MRCRQVVDKISEYIDGELDPELVREKAPPEEWSAAVRSGQREDPLLSKLPLTLRSRLFQAKVLQALR